MFFKISKKIENYFPNNYQLNNEFFLNCDDGWEKIFNPLVKKIYFKGYCYNETNFINDLIENPVPKHNGNFILIYINKNDEIVITHDKERSFPLWKNKEEVGNIEIEEGQKVFASSLILIKDQIQLQNFENDYSLYNNLDLESAAYLIIKLLEEKFCWLKNKKTKPKLFFSGGIDTLICYTFLKYMSIDFELLLNEHFDYDKFTINFTKDIKSKMNYWAYNQIHHYKEPNFLVSGAMGDENFMRNPERIRLILLHYKKILNDILKKSDYHYNYFNKISNIKIFSENLSKKEKLFCLDYSKLCKNIIDFNLNDHQHWHLGNTITFTPFKDLNFLSITLGLNEEDLCRQMCDAVLQKKIIQLIEPKMLDYLSPQKNSGLHILNNFFK